MIQLIKEKIILSRTKTKLSFVRNLFLLTLLIRKLFRLPTQNINIFRKGIFWTVDLNEAIDYCLFLTGEYEPELTDAYRPLIKNKTMSIIDIGANIGAHTLFFAKFTSN